MIAEPEGADGGADAALVAERVRAALVKAGCKTAKAAGIAPAPKSTAEADDSLAGRFAALSEAEQRKRVQRWVDGSDADAVGFGLDGKALEHIRAARTLRLEAELEDVTAGMLDNDDWQARGAGRASETRACSHGVELEMGESGEDCVSFVG